MPDSKRTIAIFKHASAAFSDTVKDYVHTFPLQPGETRASVGFTVAMAMVTTGACFIGNLYDLTAVDVMPLIDELFTKLQDLKEQRST